MSRVYEIGSSDDWNSFKNESKENGTPLFVDFSAKWCGPCRLISPYFEELSSEFREAVFVKVDVDDVEDVATECGVSSMPTFMVFKDGEKVDELVGASREKLDDLVKKYAQAA